MARMGAAMAAFLAAVAVGPGAASAQDRPGTDSQARAEERAERQDTRQQLALRVVTRAERLSRLVQTHLDEARRDGDARRASCLDDVLSQTNAVVRMAHSTTERLQAAIALSDDARRRHAVTVLGVQGRRIATLRGQARVCNGERPDAEPSGQTRVIVTVEADVPDEDPTRLPDSPGSHGGWPFLPSIPPPTGSSI